MKYYYLLISAPGDCLCSIGSAMLHPGFTAPADFLYIGYDRAIPEFVKAQKFCRSCPSVILNPAAYQRFEYEMSRRLHPSDEGYYPALRAVLAGTSIKPEQLYLTYIGEQAKRDYRIHRWKNPQLPQSARDFAKDLFIPDDTRSYLLHPFSWQSNTKERHWKHWTEAILWLLREHPNTRFYMTGQNYAHSFKSDNLVNLIDATPTVLEVLALADLCDGVISTTNCLTHWAVLTDKPSVAACCWVMSIPDYYFRRWVDVVPIRLVEFSDSLEVFKSQCRALFAETRFGPFAWKPENNPCTI